MAGVTTVTVSENGTGVFTQNIIAGAHRWQADEPVEMGGLDSGPAPYDMLCAALGACTAMTLRMYAQHKKWPLEKTAVTVTHQKDAQKQDVFHRAIVVSGPLDDEQRARLLEIADKCPVHRTLEGAPVMTGGIAAA